MNSAQQTRIPEACDVVVVGGGINGTGIARDLAGRGLSVVLAERADLAAHTSSASTKLIHGGLRYLEHGEFALVRKSLQERERLLRSAPHLMWPLQFVLPHDPSMRPAWMIRCGLFLYDHLARREVLPRSRAIDLRRHEAGRALRPGLSTAFTYADGWADDARLVVACAIDARERGACILTRTACTRAQRSAQGWQITLRDASAAERRLHARAVVNAAGPWAAQFLSEALSTPSGPPVAPRALRRVQGSHIVIRRRLGHGSAYLLQTPDRRILFAIPYEGEFTLIGTTDHEIEGPLHQAQASASEIAYLCTEASRWLAQPVAPADVVWSYAGVRPLLDDEAANPSAVTRDYRLECDCSGAPLLNVWGGKLTTFRRLAEEAGDAVCDALGQPRPAWTAAAVLPGGELSTGAAATHPQHAVQGFEAAEQRRAPWLPVPLAQRWARAYGRRAEGLLAGARHLADLGEEVAPGLFEAELQHLRDDEWALEAEDVLWRRSKQGLHLGVAEQERVARWMAAAR